jgi:hypothetical protein
MKKFVAFFIFTLVISYHLNAQTIKAVIPDSGYQGTTFPVSIYGSGTQWLLSPYFQVFFDSVAHITTSDVTTINDTLITAKVAVTGKAELGWKWIILADSTHIYNKDSVLKILLSIPVVPTLKLPLNNSIGQPPTPTFLWDSNAYATSFRIQISTDSIFSTNLKYDTVVANTPLNLRPYILKSGTKYYWRVSAINSLGTSNWSTIWNFTVEAINIQVVLSTPANNSINLPPAFTFNWFKGVEQSLLKKDNFIKSILSNSKDGINGANSILNYWFEYGTDSTFATVLLRDSLLTDTIKTISGLNSLTKYYWRVKAKSEYGWGNFSASWNFTTAPPVPGAPTLVSPTNGSTGVGLLPVISWNSVQYAMTYRLQVSTDSNFVTTNLDSSGISGTQISVPSGKFVYNTKYYWRVNATNAGGTGNYSIVWNFRTQSDPLALTQTNFTSIMTPGYMASGTSTRLPVTFRATISGLVPNKTYRYYNQSALYTDLGTTALGAGILVLINTSTGTYTYSSTGNLTTTGQYESFVANSSGSYTGWFAFLNSGNARFTAGNYVMPSVVIGDSVGTILARYALNDSIKVLGYSASTGANNGTGIYGVSLGIPKSFVALYDNSTGTGKPLSMTYIENPGITLSSIIQFYTDSVYTRNGRWGTIVPNILSNGVRRVEQRSITDGSIMSFNSDEDGVWPSGVNTVNPAGGTTPIRLDIIDAPLLNAPVLVTPENGLLNVSLTPSFTWNTVGTANSYRIQVSSDSLFTTTSFDSAGISGVTVTIPSGKLTEHTKYYWRVNATNVSGTGSYSTIFNFTTVSSAPNAPTLSLPVNGAINLSLTPTMVWNNVTDAISYRIQVANDSVFSTIVLDSAGVTKDTMIVPAGKLVNNTKYYWHVNATNAGGTSLYSTIFNFTTIPAIPLAPTLVSPVNGATNLAPAIKFDWNSVPAATSYRIKVATDTSFITVVIDSTISEDSLALSGFLANGLYYWKVAAINNAGTGPYSSVWNFRINPVGINNYSSIIPKEFKLYGNFPNPFNPTTKIRFDIPQNSSVKILVYDMTGREIQQLVNRQLSAGAYEYEFDGSNFASGIYFYRMQVADYLSVKKMVLIK